MSNKSLKHKHKKSRQKIKKDNNTNTKHNLQKMFIVKTVFNPFSENPIASQNSLALKTFENAKQAARMMADGFKKEAGAQFTIVNSKDGYYIKEDSGACVIFVITPEYLKELEISQKLRPLIELSDDINEGYTLHIALNLACLQHLQNQKHNPNWLPPFMKNYVKDTDDTRLKELYENVGKYNPSIFSYEEFVNGRLTELNAWDEIEAAFIEYKKTYPEDKDYKEVVLNLSALSQGMVARVTEEEQRAYNVWIKVFPNIDLISRYTKTIEHMQSFR